MKKCMGKLQLIHFSYIPNSLFPNVHKIVSQQAHALLPFVFFRAKSGLFWVIIAVILSSCLVVARMKKGENRKSALPL